MFRFTRVEVAPVIVETLAASRGATSQPGAAGGVPAMEAGPASAPGPAPSSHS